MRDSIQALLERGWDPREAAMEALRAVLAFAEAEDIPLTPCLPTAHLGPTNDGTVPWCRAEFDVRVKVIYLGLYRPVPEVFEFVQVGQPLPRYRQWCLECLRVYERAGGVPFPVLNPTDAR